MRPALWKPDLARVGGATRSSSASRALPPGDWADWGEVHDALFCPHAGEAYVALDAQICAVEILCRGVESSPDRAYGDRWVAHVDRVRDALYELHFGAVDARTPRWDDKGSPLGAYLVAGHLWCREVLEGLRRHVSSPVASASSQAGSLAARSSAYAASYVEPLFGELLLPRSVERGPDHAPHPSVQRAARVHAEIVRPSCAPTLTP